MNKRLLAIIALTVIILCTFSACREPNNSGNGGAVVPGVVAQFK
jgi:hypothetical protein